MHKFILIKTVLLCSLGVLESQPNFDSISQSINTIYNNSGKEKNFDGALFKIKKIPGYIFEMNETDSSKKKKMEFISSKWIELADSLLEGGYDPNLDYSKIKCFRWSEVWSIDTTTVKGKEIFNQYETNRIKNNENCEEMTKYGNYISFCEGFNSFYRSNKIKKKIIFELISDYAINKKKELSLKQMFKKSIKGKNCREYQRR